MKKILTILTCLFFLVGCSNNKNDTQNNKEKVSSEIEYFSTQIADLLNNLNNISLENYELISEKINMSKESQGQSSSQEGEKSESGSKQSSSQSNGQSSESGGESKDQSVAITSMQNSSILKKDIEDVDWDKMRSGIENINTSWSVVMLDLNDANVSNDDIMAFGNLLDATIIGIKNEDKRATLSNLSNLYSYIPKFTVAISEEKHVQNIENTKYHIFMAYSAVSQDDWNTVSTHLSNAESNFLNVLNDTEYTKNREFKVNRTYMLIKELQNSVINMDKQLFFLKYINLMESIETLK